MCVEWVIRFSTEMRLKYKTDANFLPLVSVDCVLLNPAGQMLLGH
jgi:hypothetical protein